MAELIMMWKCVDGFTTYTEGEAIAYELKLTLVKAVQDLTAGKVVKDNGHVDAKTVAEVAKVVTVTLVAQADALEKAIAPVVPVEPVPVEEPLVQ
jgi:uncharacterized protein (UPF0264 family)